MGERIALPYTGISRTQKAGIARGSDVCFKVFVAIPSKIAEAIPPNRLHSITKLEK
jgi:hypothetical protein